MKNQSNMESIRTQLEQLADEFERPPSKLDELLAVKDCIERLREKGASYKHIANSLGTLGVKTSAATIAKFCKTHLGESKKRGKKGTPKPSSRSPETKEPSRKDNSKNPETKTATADQPRTTSRSRSRPRIADANTL